jgi:hypothetical protein
LLYKLVVINKKNYILVLLYNNNIFYLTFIKLFYIRNIKIITNSLKLKFISKLYNKTKNNINIISFIISIILLKYNKEYFYKNPDFIIPL